MNGSFLSSSELYIPEENTSCSLSEMTLSRAYHTQNNLISCGGQSTYSLAGAPTSIVCEFYSPLLGWIQEPFNLKVARSGHTSWTLNNGSVLLMGGNFSDTTTELVKLGQGTQPGFDLEYPSKLVTLYVFYDHIHVCLATPAVFLNLRRRPFTLLEGPTTPGHGSDLELLVLIKTFYNVFRNNSSSEPFLQQVTKYGPVGFLKSFPPLRTGRYDHACSGYYDQEEHFILLVAGGYNRGSKLD